MARSESHLTALRRSRDLRGAARPVAAVPLVVHASRVHILLMGSKDPQKVYRATREVLDDR